MPNVITTDVYRTRATPQQIIRRALRLLGVLAPDTALAGEMLTDGLESLNDMLDSWNIEKLVVQSLQRNTFPLQANKFQYSIGTNGTEDFNAVRPVHLEQGQVFLTGGTLGILEIELDAIPLETYGRILNKTISSIPGRFFYNAQPDSGIIYLDPQPNDAYTLILWLEQIFAQIASTATSQVLVLAPGYKEAIVYNLAMELAPEYEVTPSPLLTDRAAKAKANIKRMNQRDLTLEGDAAIAGEVRRGTGWIDPRAFATGGF